MRVDLKCSPYSNSKMAVLGEVNGVLTNLIGVNIL